MALFMMLHFPNDLSPTFFLVFSMPAHYPPFLPPHILLKCPISPPLIPSLVVFSPGFSFSLLSLNQDTDLDATSVLLLRSE